MAGSTIVGPVRGLMAHRAEPAGLSAECPEDESETAPRWWRRRPATHHRIALGVGVFYFLGSWWIFRDVILAIPDILGGKRILVGDELVPFFNPTSQLFDQAKGEYSQLTNGYEFRVRYSFLSTWLRHYQVLPFAVLLVIPSIVWSAYLITSWFMARVFRSLSTHAVYLGTVFPTGLIYMIMVYAKVTHFYTLVLGLMLMSISAFVMLDALLFRHDKWVRRMVLSCLVTLLNPAVHYLILFALFLSLSTTTLLLGELARWVRRGGPGRLVRAVRRPQKSSGDGADIRERWSSRLRRYLNTTTGRCAVAMMLLVFVAVIPYGLFVKFIALRGIPNLSETVPGDYYFIRDASVSLVHVLSWDLAGIMDKIQFGDYLAKVPRVSNIVYMALIFIPIAVPGVRGSLFPSRPHRQLLGVVYANIAFAIWATVGYGEPTWLPTFHRSLSAVTRGLYATESPVGDLALTASSTIVQVLRFPHRFQLILFMLGPLLMALPLAWAADRLHLRVEARRRTATIDQRIRPGYVVLAVALGSVFFVPFLSNAPYRAVYGSGDFNGFFSAYPVVELKELKNALQDLPQGKTVVLPPTETAKLVIGPDGVPHKFIDKFYIYYLDEPSFYYGLTGDSENKFQFFLLLRSLYYQQDWWLNIARDIGLDYIVLNKQIEDNRGVGAEYLPELETYLREQIESQPEYVETVFENNSFVLYRLADPAPAQREILLFDTSWKDYLDTVFARLNLSRCYDFHYLAGYDGATADTPGVNLVATDLDSAAVSLWARNNMDHFFAPSSRTFAFNPDVVSSAYYLSPMFRLYLFFSDTKWNRNEMITPGLFGTLTGSFVGVPRSTELKVPINVPESNRYRLLLRGAATANRFHVESETIELDRDLELRSPDDALRLYESSIIYEPDRVATDGSQYSAAELEDLIPNELVPVNLRPVYHDLGVVEAKAGAHVLVLDKLDDNPMLIEGILLIPENDYRQLSIPNEVNVVENLQELGCSELVAVRSGLADGVESVANDVNPDLTQDELLELMGVDDLITPNPSGDRRRAVHLIAAVLIVLVCSAVIRWRATVELPEDVDRSG
jgi:hypothetical protein